MSSTSPKAPPELDYRLVYTSNDIPLIKKHLEQFRPYPQTPELISAVAYLFSLHGKSETALELLSQSAKLQPESPTNDYIKALIGCRSALSQHQGWALLRDGCLRAIQTAERIYGSDLSPWPLYEICLSKLAEMSQMVGPDSVALESARTLVQMFPNNPSYRRYLSSALAETGDLAAAVDQLLTSCKIQPEPSTVLELSDLVQVLEKKQKTRQKTARSRFPSNEEMVSNLDETIKIHLLGEINSDAFNFHLTRKTPVFTLGSCFAREIATCLKREQFNCAHLEMAENVNSTYANIALLEWALGTLPEGAVRARLDFLTRGTYSPEALLAKLTETSLFIYTLGVAPCFFDRNTGEFVMPMPTKLNSRAMAEVYDFKTTSVQENVENLKKIHRILLSLNPAAKMVVTLSPVPIKVTFERQSAVIADCISKSTLRLAAEEFVREHPENLLYWPSFEIVRWLGGHVGPFFGGDDGAAWHVNADIIAKITRLFVDRFGSSQATTEGTTFGMVDRAISESNRSQRTE